MNPRIMRVMTEIGLRRHTPLVAGLRPVSGLGLRHNRARLGFASKSLPSQSWLLYSVLMKQVDVFIPGWLENGESAGDNSISAAEPEIRTLFGCSGGHLWTSWFSNGKTPMNPQSSVVLLMIEILHDLIYQNNRNYESILHMGLCRISILNSMST